MLDVTCRLDQDQGSRTLVKAAKSKYEPETHDVDLKSAPTSPGAWSSLSSAGPSWVGGSPMGTPQQDQEDVVSRSMQADDQLQQFKWSENPMLGVASPAVSGVFQTPSSAAHKQPNTSCDTFFTPYNNSTFNEATVGNSDQFYTPMDGGALRAVSRAANMPSLSTATAVGGHVEHKAGEPSCVADGGAAADAPCEWKAMEAPSAVSLRSISNMGSPEAGEIEGELQLGQWEDSGSHGEAGREEGAASADQLGVVASAAAAAPTTADLLPTAAGAEQEVPLLQSEQQQAAMSGGELAVAPLAVAPSPPDATPYLIKRVRGGSASPLACSTSANPHTDLEPCSASGLGNEALGAAAAAAAAAAAPEVAQELVQQHAAGGQVEGEGQAGAEAVAEAAPAAGANEVGPWPAGARSLALGSKQGTAVGSCAAGPPQAPALPQARKNRSGGNGSQHPSHTPPPCPDPRALAASLSSKGRHSRWVCGHAATPPVPTPTPTHPPHPKPHATTIPEHLLRATSLVLRANRPEPDPVSARRLKMTLPKTPTLATAQRLGSHPPLQQGAPAPAMPSAVPALHAPGVRPRRASYTHSTPAPAAPAAGSTGKPRRASYTHAPAPPPAAPGAVPTAFGPHCATDGATETALSAEEAAEVAARFAQLSSRVTSLDSRRAASGGLGSQRGMAAAAAMLQGAPERAGGPSETEQASARGAGGSSQAATPPCNLAHAASAAAVAPPPPTPPTPARGTSPAPVGAAKKAASMVAREGARASAVAAAEAAARAKAARSSDARLQQVSPMKRADVVPSTQDGAGSAASGAVAAGLPGVNAATAAARLAPPRALEVQACCTTAATPERKQAARAVGAPVRAAVAPTPTPPKSRPGSAAATPERGAAAAAAATAAGLPQARHAQPARAASTSERKAWPGLPPTRAQQRGASAAGTPEKQTGAAGTPGKRGGVAGGPVRSAPAPAAATKAQQAQATVQRRVQAAGATVRPGSAPGPAGSKLAAPAPRPSTAAAEAAGHVHAAGATATAKAPTNIAGFGASPGPAPASRPQHTAGKTGSAFPATAASGKLVRQGGRPGVAGGAGSKAAAAPAPPTMPAAGALPTRKPAVPKLGKRTAPAAAAPAPAPTPAPPLEPLPSFFKKPGVPRLSAKAAGRPVDAAAPSAAAKQAEPLAARADKQAGAAAARPAKQAEAAEARAKKQAEAAEASAREQAEAAVKAAEAAEVAERAKAAEAQQAAQARAAAEARAAEETATGAAAGGQAAKGEGAGRGAAEAPVAAATTEKVAGPEPAASPAFVRPLVPKLNMEAVAAAAARDNEEEQQAAAAAICAPPLACPLPHNSSSSSSIVKAGPLKAASAGAAPSKPHAAGAATAAAAPARPATAPATGAKGKAGGAAAAAAGAAAKPAAREGRVRQSSAAVPQVRPPGMWSPPPTRAGAAGAPQRAAPGGRVRRSSCTAALASGSAGPANPGRAAAMAARLMAVKEEGAILNGAAENGGAPPAEGPCPDVQVRTSLASKGTTFESPAAEQQQQQDQLGGNSAHAHCSDCGVSAADAAAGVHATPCLMPKPGTRGPTDLSLAWATTPCTSVAFQRRAPRAAGSASTSGSSGSASVSLAASPTGSSSGGSMPQLMPSLGAGLPTPFVPAPVDDSSRAATHQQKPWPMAAQGLLSTCGREGERDEGGRVSLGAAAMTPVLMHPFAVATPAPQGTQETPRLGLQAGRRATSEDTTTPAGLPLLTPAPQLPDVQELIQLVREQQMQQAAQAAGAGRPLGAEKEDAEGLHLRANLPPSAQVEWDDASYEVCCSPGPAAPVPGRCSRAASPPSPLPQYEEWGSPDDSPSRDQAGGRDGAGLAHAAATKLQAAGVDVKGSLDIAAAAHANFSFTSEIGALRMSTFEPATLPRAL